MNNEKRYCDRFNMTANQLYDYKLSKKTRIVWYVIAMIAFTIFKDRITAYVCLTFLLCSSYYHNYKCEEQWIKDGSARLEDFR